MGALSALATEAAAPIVKQTMLLNLELSQTNERYYYSYKYTITIVCAFLPYQKGGGGKSSAVAFEKPIEQTQSQGGFQKQGGAPPWRLNLTPSSQRSSMSAPQSSLIKARLSNFVSPNQRVTFSPNKQTNRSTSFSERVGGQTD